MNKRLLLFMTSLLVVVVVFGQAVATLDDDQLLMGKKGRLEIEVPMPNDTSHVEFPLLQEALAQKKKYVSFLNDTVEILVAHSRALDVKDDRYYIRYDLSVQAFDSGRYEIPAMEFIVDGEKMKSNPVTLEVLPVKVKADDKLDDFSDVAAPFEVNPNQDELEEDAAAFIWWIIAAVILIALGSVGFLMYRKNGRIFPTGKPQAPYQVALEKLHKLRNQNLPERGRTKDYYTRLTDILRGYLRKQFDIRTLEKTSAEILTQVASNEAISRYEGLLREIFETADFVKFAKVNTSEVENSKCMKEAVGFVEASRPDETSVKDDRMASTDSDRMSANSRNKKGGRA